MTPEERELADLIIAEEDRQDEMDRELLVHEKWPYPSEDELLEIAEFTTEAERRGLLV